MTFATSMILHMYSQIMGGIAGKEELAKKAAPGPLGEVAQKSLGDLQQAKAQNQSSSIASTHTAKALTVVGAAAKSAKEVASQEAGTKSDVVINMQLLEHHISTPVGPIKYRIYHINQAGKCRPSSLLPQCQMQNPAEIPLPEAFGATLAKQIAAGSVPADPFQIKTLQDAIEYINILFDTTCRCVDKRDKSQSLSPLPGILDVYREANHKMAFSTSHSSCKAVQKSFRCLGSDGKVFQKQMISRVPSDSNIISVNVVAEIPSDSDALRTCLPAFEMERGDTFVVLAFNAKGTFIKVKRCKNFSGERIALCSDAEAKLMGYDEKVFVYFQKMTSRKEVDYIKTEPNDPNDKDLHEALKAKEFALIHGTQVFLKITSS